MEDFYCIDSLLEVDANYSLLIGERSNGKSYAVKYHCIEDFINNGQMFILLRRLSLEITGKGAFWAQSYFDDVDISKLNISKEEKKKYDTISVYGGGIYLAHFEEDKSGKLKLKRDKLMGRVMALGAAAHVKSMVGNDYGNIIYEEFISSDNYLNDECNRLQQFVSTIARRRKIHVYMIGNTISRMCPYFTEWGLEHIPQQKQGTIDIYNFKTGEKEPDGTEVCVKIAVELTNHSSNSTSKMFFGAKSTAIINGVWETGVYPHLAHEYGDYTTIYAVTFILANMKYRAELLKYNGNNTYEVIYVVPSGKHITTQRIIQEQYSPNKLITDKFYSICIGDAKMKELIRMNKIVYSDNLTGSEFKNVLKTFVSSC